MKRVMLSVIVVLALAASASTAAAAQTAAAQNAPARKATKSVRKGKADPAEAQKVEVARLKGVFMFAVQSCERKGCDEQLLRDAEASYMQECKVCATEEKCGADRDVIRAGDGKRYYNPCR
jgi:guanyl-specific ribonuclease Sa